MTNLQPPYVNPAFRHPGGKQEAEVSSVSLSSPGPSPPVSLPAIRSTTNPTQPTNTGKKLRRFWFRAIVCSFIPPVITLYYATIVFLWVQKHSDDSGTEYGPAGGRLVFYSWFVIGVFRLSLSEYGLAGAEASMLMSYWWKARHVRDILMQCDKTWSGPGGWLKIAGKCLARSPSGGIVRRRIRFGMPPKTWIALAIPSLLCYLGLTLSGLSIELTSGYVFVKEPAVVVGFNRTTFSQTSGEETLRPALQNWKAAKPEKPPARGVVYTRPEMSRKFPVTMGRLPNILSLDGIQEGFIAVQSDKPVSGRVWGILSSYNCSVEENLDNFSILKYRVNVTNANNGKWYDGYKPVENPNYQIYGLNATIDSFINIQAYIEIGLDFALIDPKNTGFFSEDLERMWLPLTKQGGIDRTKLRTPRTLEAILWQNSNVVVRDSTNANGYDERGTDRKYDAFLNTKQEIRSLSSAFSTRKGPFELPADFSFPEMKSPAVRFHAIGVKCWSTSAAGYAEVNGRYSTYTDFQPEEIVESNSESPDYSPNWRPAISSPIFMGVSTLLWQALHPGGLTGGIEWFQGLYQSVNGYRSRVAFEGPNSPSIPSPIVQGYAPLSATQLRQSLLQAYASYTTALMFRNSDEQSKSTDGWECPTLSTAVETTIVRPGEVSVKLVLVLLGIWSIWNMAFGIMFSFRRRWADTLDGYSLFRFGADVTTTYGLKHQFCAVDYNQCPELKSIPGLVGDAKPREDPGFITLVEDTVAAKNKKYR